MAITSVGARGTGVATSGTTVTQTPGSAVAQNSVLVTMVTYRAGGPVQSITDAVGNTWFPRAVYKNVANGNISVEVWVAVAKTALASTTTITCTFAASANDMTMASWNFGVTAGKTLVVDTTATNPVDNEVNGTTGYGSATLTGFASASRLWLRALGKQANSTTAITVTAGFTSWALTARSRNSASATIPRAEHIIATATAETSNPTLAVSGNTAGIFIALIEGNEAYTLTCAGGSFVVTGEPAGLLYTYPATLNLSFYLRADQSVPEYNGLPWAGTATLGVSGGRNGIAVTGGTAPTNSTASYNGYTAATFAHTTTKYGFRCGSGLLETDLFNFVSGNGSTSGCGFFVLELTAAQTGTLLTDQFQNIWIDVDMTALTATFHVTADSNLTTYSVTCSLPSAGTVFALWFKFDMSAGSIGITTDGNAWTTTTTVSGTTIHSGLYIAVGDPTNVGGISSIVGDVQEVGFSPTILSDTVRSNFYTYYQARYVASAAHTLTAAQGSFALSGQPITPAVAMPAAQGAIALTGEAATLTYTPSGPHWRAGWSGTISGFASSCDVVTSPAVGDYYVVWVERSSSTSAPSSVTDDNGGTYTLKESQDDGAGNALFLYVRDQLLANTSTTTVTVSFGGFTNCLVRVAAVSGMQRFGVGGIRQTAKTFGTASAPAPAFSASALTANPVLGALADSGTTGTPVAPTGWTERSSDTDSTTGRRLESISRDSGFTGTTVTWGFIDNNSYAAIVVELDGSAPAAYTLTAAQGSFVETGEPATFAVALPAAQASFVETGNPIVPAVALPASTGTFAETGIAAAFAVKMPAAQGAFAETGQPVTPAVGMAAAVGTFGETGVAASLLKASRIVATQGSFVESGLPITLAVDLSAALGSFALSDNPVAFAVGMPATAGAIALSGQAAVLKKSTILTASQGSFLLTGQPITFTLAIPTSAGIFALSGGIVGLVSAHTLTTSFGTFGLLGEPVTFRLAMSAAQGSFGESGQSVAFAMTIPTSGGAFAISGQPAVLVTARTMAAAQGVFALTGLPVAFGVVVPAAVGLFAESGQPTTFAVAMPAGTGSFSFTGEDAALVYGSLGHYTLVAAPGAFTLTGESSGLVQARLLTAQPAALALSGQPAILTREITIASQAGLFDLSGTPATLRSDRLLIGGQGSLSLLGQDAVLRRDGRLLAQPGLFAETGIAAGLESARILSAQPGTFSWNGQVAALIHGYSLVAGGGTFVSVGSNTGLVSARILQAIGGSYELTGEAINLVLSFVTDDYVVEFVLPVLSATARLDPSRATVSMDVASGATHLDPSRATVSMDVASGVFRIERKK